MRKYELTYLVSDEVPESDLNKVTGKVTGFVTELGGKVTKEDIWGRRKLAYPIKKQDFATYVTLYFDLPADKAVEFERDLRHIEGVLRQLMIVKEFGGEEITLSAADVAATEEIQDVVGGEKSFEAIEGETEESRKLMAKREEKEEANVEPAEKEKVPTTEGVGIPTESVGKVKKTKKAAPKAKVSTKAPKEETVIEEKPKKAPAKKVPTTEGVGIPTESVGKAAPKAKTESKKVNDEVERLSKLNEELDDILKDEL